MRVEGDVGILYRIPFGNQPAPAEDVRLTGLLKQRYSDFHVHEIDDAGQILHLNSFKLPNDTKEDELSIPLDEKFDYQIDNLLLEWLPQSVQDEVKHLQTLLEPTKRSLEINVTTADKEIRTKIHRWLGRFDKLSTRTMEKEGQKFIQISRPSRNVLSRERRPFNRAKYTHCLLYKEGIDTSDAINFLCRKLRMQAKHITFAGTKDKQAKTVQQICFSNTDAKRLVYINAESPHSKLGNFSYKDSPLHLGQLRGNHFKILIRDVQVPSEGFISMAIDSLSRDGFINYFGLQRFGSFRISTHLVGKALLQMNWLKAFDLILEPKEKGDQEFMKKAKKLWLEKRDAIGAWKAIPRHHQSIEASLLYGLSKYYATGDYWSAFRGLPRNMRTLYFHAYQSYLWNHLATHRIQEYGLLPVVGDLVCDNPESEASLENDLEMSLDDFGVGNQDDSRNGDSANQSGAKGNIPIIMPVLKVLSQEDLVNYTIFDVIIPMEGRDVKIPATSILKTYSDKLLAENGMSDGFPDFRPISELPKGSLRKVVVLPKDVNYRVIPYNDLDNLDTFIPSDYDLMVQEQKPTDTVTGPNETPKDKTCVIVQFSLPASSYATMALRQILEAPKEIEKNVGGEDLPGEKRPCDVVGTEAEEYSSSAQKKPKLEHDVLVGSSETQTENNASSFTAGEKLEND